MTRTASQAGKLASRKGKTYERRIVLELNAAGILCHRNIEQTLSARRSGCDIEGTRWWLELCHAKRADPRKKHAQAVFDQLASGRARRPIIVIWRRDGMAGDLATMSADDYMDLACNYTDACAVWGHFVTLDLQDAVALMVRREAR